MQRGNTSASMAISIPTGTLIKRTARIDRMETKENSRLSLDMVIIARIVTLPPTQYDRHLHSH